MLREYKVILNGCETTVQMCDETAERYGLTPIEPDPQPAVKERKPANKARKAATK